MFKVIAEPQFRESLGKTSEELQEAFEGQLNELASQGWKLVKFEFPNGPNGNTYYALMEKEG